MRNVSLPLLFILGYATAFAQVPSRLSIKGSVTDSAGAPLSGATVMLLTPKDSVLSSFGRSTDKGTFEFKNVKRASYLLKITYVGYLPFQKIMNTPEGEAIDVGTAVLKPISKELLEVVVKTARAPLTIHGDTVEYNATTFKVPPGSSVEELLRKLPGVQVDQDGTIHAQGQTVQRVTVDGKSFFGDDPKLATKNLPAEAIAKVQIFSSQSEQSKITGVTDGQPNKTMNLELKDSFRNSGFGKVTASAGGGSGSPRGRFARQLQPLRQDPAGVGDWHGE